MTKTVNVFDQTQREIRCIAREHDYLGDGTIFTEDDLEVGKIYTFVHGRAMSYGNMVFLKELPSRMGFQSYLFEELKEYDEEEFLQRQREWLLDRIGKSLESVKKGRMISSEEFDAKIEAMMRYKPFDPQWIVGHDPGAAYWIYPVKAEGDGRTEEFQEYREFQISISEDYFDWLLTDFFVDGIDPELNINARRISTDYIPGGAPIYGFAWDLHPNFYTRKDMEAIMRRMTETAEVLRSGHIDQLPSRQKNRLRKTFARVAEDESEMTYQDAMMKTAEFYDRLILRLQRMMAECKETDTICVMTP